jgi:hypothetical protein
MVDGASLTMDSSIVSGNVAKTGGVFAGGNTVILNTLIKGNSAENGSIFNSLEVTNHKVFVTDAIDYQQNGDVLIYSTSGQLLRSLKAGIIPSAFCFVK